MESDVKKYCQMVLTGKKPSNLYERLAVERYISDRKNKKFEFRNDKAEHVIRFFSFLKHSKGEFAGKPFELEPWQKFILWNLFGFYNKDGTRRYNYAYIEVPRKNGKSTLAAGIALYLLDADGEPASEVYCFATKEEQAKKTIFNEAKNMVKTSPLLSKRIDVYTKSIFNEISLSYLQPLGSDSTTQDGLNTHAGINDEYHAHKTDGMMNVMKSSTGSRRNWMIFTITTAGLKIDVPCYAERDACTKILKGIIEQDNKFAIIYTIDEEDDWKNPLSWEKANPNWGVSLKKKYIENEFHDSVNNPTRTNNFKTKHLNVWTRDTITWIRHEDWNRCDMGLKLPDLTGRTCYGGLDLASHMDFNCFALLFTDKKPFDLWVWTWMPEGKLTFEREQANYQQWIDAGYLSTTIGDVADIDTITNKILEVLKTVNCQSIAFDPARAFHGVIQNLQKQNITMSEFRQGFITMDTPTKEFEKLVVSRGINHGGNKLLGWMLSNCSVLQDDAGNIKVSKRRSAEKIDGIVASIMAVGEHLTYKEPVNPNDVYEHIQL
jgi:phage terminase large subunit-like protein